MMGLEQKCVRCSLGKTLPFSAVEQQLKEQLGMSGMGGAIRVSRENDRTLRVTYHNYQSEGVKHILQLVCDKVDYDEATRRGDWHSNYPSVQITLG